MLAGDHSKDRNREQGCTHSTDSCCLLMFKNKDSIDPSSQPESFHQVCKSLAWDTIVKEVDLAGRSTPELLKGTLGVCGGWAGAPAVRWGLTEHVVCGQRAEFLGRN